jgi:hypothetical protein
LILYIRERLKMEYEMDLDTRQGFIDHLEYIRMGEYLTEWFKYLVKSDNDMKQFWQYFDGSFDDFFGTLSKLWRQRKDETPIKSFAHFIYAYHLNRKDALESLFAEQVQDWHLEILDDRLRRNKITLDELYHEYIRSSKSRRFLNIIL